MIAKDSFWDVPEKTTSILKERTKLSEAIETWDTLVSDIEENDLLLTMAMEESHEESLEEVKRSIPVLEKRIKKLSIELMLTEEDDSCDAIVSINAGAGGTDSQDWAEMLLRMYRKWSDKKGFSLKTIDYQPGDEAGIKSVTFMASGPNAYGYLKAESGVHRLVRISPFNANGKRQTSFTSVFVYPEIDRDIVIEIEERDLRIDVYRAGGAGGQHVNKTNSAVRITHQPTNIVVQCQQEPSQHKNKEIAMKVLKARLYQHEKMIQNQKLQEMHDDKDDIAWGSQIRSYILHPYRLVKDHRTSHETGNVNKVLDGDLDPFIETFLLS